MIGTDEFLTRLRDRLVALPDPKPDFRPNVELAADYDHLFADQFEETAAAMDILRRAMGFGRILLTGRGGGAKTVILVRIAKAAIEQEIAAILITLKEWTSADNIEWEELSTYTDRVAHLMLRFSGLGIHPRSLDNLDTNLPRLLILDGLNEVTANIGQQIIDAFDEYARFALNTSIIVSDRLVRRDFIRSETHQRTPHFRRYRSTVSRRFRRGLILVPRVN